MFVFVVADPAHNFPFFILYHPSLRHLRSDSGSTHDSLARPLIIKVWFLLSFGSPVLSGAPFHERGILRLLQTPRGSDCDSHSVSETFRSLSVWNESLECSLVPFQMETSLNLAEDLVRSVRAPDSLLTRSMLADSWQRGAKQL